MLSNHWLAQSSSGAKIAADLRLKIIEGHYQPQDLLSENQLANLYGTSRSPIRDAIKILVSENLLQNERMGVSVIGLSVQDIEEIYDIRLMIESFVFEKLLQEEVTDLLQVLKKTLAMMEVAIQFQDADEFTLQDMMFHQSVIHSIHHQQIFYLWQNLRPIMETLVLISMRRRMTDNIRDFERVISNHALYIEAIEKKDRSLFKQAMHLNFDDVDSQIEVLWHSSMNEKDD